MFPCSDPVFPVLSCVSCAILCFLCYPVFPVLSCVSCAILCFLCYPVFPVLFCVSCAFLCFLCYPVFPIHVYITLLCSRSRFQYPRPNGMSLNYVYKTLAHVCIQHVQIST